MEQDKIKKIFYGAVTFTVLVLAYGIFVAAGAYSKSVQPGNYRSFAVRGEGRVTAKNDIARFTYSVVIEGGKDIAAIRTESDSRTEKIQTFLKEQGVKEEDVQTISYSLEPRYQYYPCPTPVPGAAVRPCQPQEIVGYTLKQTDSVKIRDLAKADAVVGGIVDNGANDVSQLSFTVDDAGALETEAKGLAIKQAVERAESIARVAGVDVGRIIAIEEEGNYPLPVYMGYGADAKLESAPTVAGRAANLNPGSNEIISNVVVRFEID